MQLVAGFLNNVTLDALHAAHTSSVSEILVAVAYADNSFLPFLKEAADKQVKLTFYGRYETSLPVALPVIEWFLENKWRKTAECSLVPDFYHPKVIWWRGRGAYIGSANLSKRGWQDNIELGTFFSEQELAASGMGAQLTTVFAQIKERAHPIDKDLRDKMRDLASALARRTKAEKDFESYAEKHRWIPKGRPLSAEKQSVKSHQQESYLRRRRKVIVYLEEVGALLASEVNRPSWLPQDVPTVLQVDQFLFAYCEQFPGNKGRNNEEVKATNQHRHGDALREAVDWWAAGDYKYEKLREQLVDIYRLVNERFGRSRIRTLSKEEFLEAFKKIHAVGERARNRKNDELGFDQGSATQEMRLHRHAEQVWGHVSVHGKNVLDLLEFVIWQDSLYSLEERIHMGANSPIYKLREILENTLSDIVGWVRPELSPPINGRTLKGLQMLGYQVDADGGDPPQ